jgi:hypothetical protein
MNVPRRIGDYRRTTTSLSRRMAPGDPSERHSNHVAVVRLILAAASLATVLGLICVAFVPASGRIIDIAAAIFALATWVVPPLLAVKSRNKKRSSLASVGFVIGLFVVAACLSVMGVSLALLTLFFTKDANWAWPALLTIAAFWVSAISLSYFGSRRPLTAREDSK